MRLALKAVATVEVDLDGTTGLALTDDLEPTPEPPPAVALLPALDPTPMGWLERDWFLGGHRAALFDRSGNVGPTIFYQGRIVGGWTQSAGRRDPAAVAGGHRQSKRRAPWKPGRLN